MTRSKWTTSDADTRRWGRSVRWRSKRRGVSLLKHRRPKTNANHVVKPSTQPDQRKACDASSAIVISKMGSRRDQPLTVSKCLGSVQQTSAERSRLNQSLSLVVEVPRPSANCEFDCDRTVIRGLQDPEEYGGLQGHTEGYFQAANSLRACTLRSLRVLRCSSRASLSKRA